MSTASQLQVDLITKDLGQWPEDLRRHWLSREVETKGWPPLPGSKWGYAIGAQRTLDYLQQMRWVRTTLSLQPDMIAPESLLVLIQMFRGYYYRDPAAGLFAGFDGGRERFEGLVKYLLSNSRFPWPPALERASDGLHILDGHHRVLALLYLAGYLKSRDDDQIPTYKDYSLDYWISNCPACP